MDGWEVHVFLGLGEARGRDGFEKGARHSLLIFCRQSTGEAPNESLARKSASQAGWKNIRLERSRRLPATAQPAEPALLAALHEALEEGAAVVAHRRKDGR